MNVHRPAADDRPEPFSPPTWEPVSTKPPLRIRDVRTVCTAPEGAPLVVLKIETTEPELFGLGCASLTTRPHAVRVAVEEYLRPFLVGRDPDEIEDIWQSAVVSSYWRSDPVLNNALSGVDQALWDIKGKRAGMPLFNLLGGKVRAALPVYSHAGGRDAQGVTEHAQAILAEGIRYVRCQVAVPGHATYGVPGEWSLPPGARVPPGGLPFEPTAYCRTVPALFEHLRRELGDAVELMHDVHERVPPIHAIGLAKQLEPYNLFFLEDPLAPEDIGSFPLLRQQTSIPIAMGELFVNPAEYLGLITGRLIDFVRIHISDIGGISPARKLAAVCAAFGVRTAWHGPGDVSPVGHAANVHLGLASPSFGIQELFRFGESTRAVFPGAPELRDGMLWANDRPGLGIDLDEAAAARYPLPAHALSGGLATIRRQDGTVVRP